MRAGRIFIILLVFVFSSIYSYSKTSGYLEKRNMSKKFADTADLAIKNKKSLKFTAKQEKAVQRLLNSFGLFRKNNRKKISVLNKTFNTNLYKRKINAEVNKQIFSQMMKIHKRNANKAIDSFAQLMNILDAKQIKSLHGLMAKEK